MYIGVFQTVSLDCHTTISRNHIPKPKHGDPDGLYAIARVGWKLDRLLQTVESERPDVDRHQLIA
jgi:hypothetical protein